jgi:predicted GNAT superfamily acetyltransferase
MSEAWAAARAAARAAAVDLRPLSTVEDAEQINAVIAATWGGQRLDREVIRALAVSGNVPWGAFDGDEMVGFVLGWAGVDAGGLHVHSHMLAALPDRRSGGAGYALKLAQRAQALDQGISWMRWTFDPLVARNAWFNLGKLGAVIDGFERAFYGEMTDAINLGERSDRCTVAWDLRAPLGPRRGNVPSSTPAALARIDDGTWPRPASVGSPEADLAVLEIPAEYHELRADDPSLGRAWREAAAVAVEACLGRGLVGVAFLRERSAYLFSRPDVRAPS